MQKTILSILILTAATTVLGSDAKTPRKNLPSCCQEVERIIHVNPAPRYPKDPRQYLVVRKRVTVVVCRHGGDHSEPQVAHVACRCPKTPTRS